MKATILLITGLIIIITPISIAIWNVIKSKPVTKDICYICVISLIIGLPVIMIDRITEIPIPYIGTIKAATEQATSDSQEVSRLRKRIESQSATIDLVAQNATDAKKLSTEAKSLYEELSNKNILADKELKNISDKILPLELKADSLLTLTKKTRKEILRTQERLNIQKLMISSIAGSRPDYEKLNKIAGKKSRIQTYANSAIRNVFFYFMSEKYLTSYPILVDPISKKTPGYSVDEVIFIYHDTDPKRDAQESAVNTLADLNRVTAVQELCDSIDKEQNLRVISRMTRTLEKLTGEYFYPLDIDAVKKWWGEPPNKEKYKSCYKGLLEVRALEKRPSLEVTKMITNKLFHS